MDINPYTQFPTLIVGEDGSRRVEHGPVPDGYAPNFDLQSAHDAQWEKVRVERARRIAASDWVVTRSVERGEPVPPEWQDYRQALRDVTLQANPFLIEWPQEPAQGAPTRRAYHTQDEYEANTIVRREL